MMRGSRRTSFLLAAAVSLLLVHFFPQFAAPVAWLALAAGAMWLVMVGSRLVAYYREKRSSAAQQASDEGEYRSYKAELDALRARHDPDHEWNESTEYPAAYRELLSGLHERHRAMLDRRFGPIDRPSDP